jgi:hypothetical protein
MPEVKIDKTTNLNNKVYFPGTAQLSDRAAEGYERDKQNEAEAQAETEAQNQTEEVKPETTDEPKAKGKK